MRKFRGFVAIWTPAFEFSLALMALMLIIAVTESPVQKTPTAPTLGYFAITQTTPNGNPNDVDLYVRDPKGNTAYFNAMSVGLMNLEFDVIEGVTDAQGHGFAGDKCDCERTILRGIVPGEYIVDVQMYLNQTSRSEPVTVALWSLARAHAIITKTVTLGQSGDWKTAFRFTLDAAGNVTSTSTLPLDIVNPTQTGTLG